MLQMHAYVRVATANNGWGRMRSLPLKGVATITLTGNQKEVCPYFSKGWPPIHCDDAGEP